MTTKRFVIAAGYSWRTASRVSDRVTILHRTSSSESSLFKLATPSSFVVTLSHDVSRAVHGRFVSDHSPDAHRVLFQHKILEAIERRSLRCRLYPPSMLIPTVTFLPLPSSLHLPPLYSILWEFSYPTLPFGAQVCSSGRRTDEQCSCPLKSSLQTVFECWAA